MLYGQWVHLNADILPPAHDSMQCETGSSCCKVICHKAICPMMPEGTEMGRSLLANDFSDGKGYGF